MHFLIKKSFCTLLLTITDKLLGSQSLTLEQLTPFLGLIGSQLNQVFPFNSTLKAYYSCFQLCCHIKLCKHPLFSAHNQLHLCKLLTTFGTENQLTTEHSPTSQSTIKMTMQITAKINKSCHNKTGYKGFLTKAASCCCLSLFSAAVVFTWKFWPSK
jgi:hypothetical protein